MNDLISSLLSVVLLVAALPFAFAYVLGGDGWGKKVMALYGRILRTIFASPFMLIGWLFNGVGASIKGGGKKKRKS